MAGSIDYVSFPRFSRRRRLVPAGLLTICIPLTKALQALRNIISCLQPWSRNQGMSATNEASRGRFSSWLKGRKHAEPGLVYMVTKKNKASSAYRIFSLRFNMASTGNAAGSNSETSGSPSTSFRERITRQVWPFTRATSQGTAAGDDPLQPGSSSCLQHAVRVDDALIADLDALSLSEPEREILKRMEQVCHAATVAQEKRLRASAASSVHDNRHNVTEIPHLHLRGGGDDLPHSSRGPRRRTTLPYTPPADPFPDSFRPSVGLWWLAGGQRSQHGRVPTLGELRVRKEVERANRGIVGFWGTVLGLRRVGRVGILSDDGEADDGSLVGDVLEEGDGVVDENAMGAAGANSVANSVRSSKKDGNGKGSRVSAKAGVEDAAGSVHSAGQNSSKEAGVTNERGSI